MLFWHLEEFNIQQIPMTFLRQLIWTAIFLTPSIAMANPSIWDLVVGESDLNKVNSKYDLTKMAVISSVRKSVYEVAVDQLNSEDIFGRSKVRSVTLLFNETSILSDIHTVYENWNFSDVIAELDKHFETSAKANPVYGDESVKYSWFDYDVSCFFDAVSGFTHIVFSAN